MPGRPVAVASQGLESRTLLTSVVLTEQTGTENPFNGISVGSFSTPVFGDLDGDGDLDLITGENFGTLKYYKNTGTALVPLFTQQTGSANPFDGISLGRNTQPAVGDLDGDGDLDLFVGEASGSIKYFENTGTAIAPVFTLRTGTANPLNSFSGSTYPVPSLEDLDADGDLDAVIGDTFGLYYFENTGTAIAPAFTKRTGSANPLDGLGIGYNYAPTLGDLDGDGDLDLMVGENQGTLFYFLNTGTAVDPVFEQQTGSANPLNGVDLGIYSKPAFGDFDQDGDLDVVGGAGGGILRYYKNTPPQAHDVGFTQKTGSANPLNGFDVGSDSVPAVGDLDGDGDLDLIAGKTSGLFSYYMNAGSATAPAFTEQTGSANPLNGVDIGNLSTLALGDLDGDGDLELISGNENGIFQYFKNTGTVLTPIFTEQMGSSNPLNGFSSSLGGYSSLTLGDLDGDGDLDLIAGNLEGEFKYYKNTGTPTVPAFTEQAGSANPLNGVDVGGRSKPTLGDADQDGDLDLILGNAEGVFFYFKNIGTPLSPIFAAQTGSSNPLDGFVIESDSAPVMGDFDHDGDLDLISGNSEGSFNYYLNNISPTDIGLTSNSVAEHSLSGTVVGLLSSVDSDDQDTFTYSLVGGTGSTNNNLFMIVGNELRTNGAFDFEVQDSCSIRIRSTDSAGGVFDKVFSISITDENDPPTDLDLSNDIVAENSSRGTPVGTFSTTDQDELDSFIYTLVSGAGDADNGSFAIVGNQLRTNAVFDFETRGSYSIRVRTTDPQNVTYEEFFTISITDENDPPTSLNLSNSSVAENSSVGTVIGNFSSTDEDASEMFTYTLVIGTGDTDNASFSIVGNELRTNAVFNFEDKDSYSIRVRTTDSQNATYEEIFSISITDANDTPTDLDLSNGSVAENRSIGTVIGTFSSTDEDSGETFSYTLVTGIGATDNASFSIIGNELRSNTIYDFESKQSYSIRVRTTDSQHATHEEVFTIGVTDVQESPILMAGFFPQLPDWWRKSKAIEGETVANIIDSVDPTDLITDQDAGAIEGFAVIDASNLNGTWECSLDGGSTWNSLADASTTNARLLNEAAKLRFVPFNKKFSGDVALTVVAWDQTSGENGVATDVTTRGGATPFSLQTTEIVQTILKKKIKVKNKQDK